MVPRSAPLFQLVAVRVTAALALALALVPQLASAADGPGEIWPVAVHARYSLRYNSLEVGRLTISTATTPDGYTVTGSGKVSVLFGTYKWTGSSKVSGVIQNGAPAPATYDFNWHHNKGKKKDVAISIGYRDNVAAEVSVNPAPRVKPDMVPLTEAHKARTLDPLSAIMVLTKADGRPPCDRRATVFDGTQRYDIVFSPKRQMQLSSLSGDGRTETAPVCRITYEPVAGHRDNADTKAYASNHDVEVVLRRVPGTSMYVPYSVTIPTEWGTGTMTADRLEVETSAGKVAIKN